MTAFGCPSLAWLDSFFRMDLYKTLCFEIRVKSWRNWKASCRVSCLQQNTVPIINILILLVYNTRLCLQSFSRCCPSIFFSNKKLSSFIWSCFVIVIPTDSRLKKKYQHHVYYFPSVSSSCIHSFKRVGTQQNPGFTLRKKLWGDLNKQHFFSKWFPFPAFILTILQLQSKEFQASFFWKPWATCPECTGQILKEKKIPLTVWKTFFGLPPSSTFVDSVIFFLPWKKNQTLTKQKEPASIFFSEKPSFGNNLFKQKRLFVLWILGKPSYLPTSLIGTFKTEIDYFLSFYTVFFCFAGDKVE